jgi:hypothetical protein
VIESGSRALILLSVAIAYSSVGVGIVMLRVLGIYRIIALFVRFRWRFRCCRRSVGEVVVVVDVML